MVGTFGNAAARDAPPMASALSRPDVTSGRVVKGVNFVSLRDAGDPVEIARRYDEQGADELTFLDITATSDDRDMIAVHGFVEDEGEAPAHIPRSQLVRIIKPRVEEVV